MGKRAHFDAVAEAVRGHFFLASLRRRSAGCPGRLPARDLKGSMRWRSFIVGCERTRIPVLRLAGSEHGPGRAS